MSTDLNLLKAIVDNDTNNDNDGEGRYTAADEAINAILHAMRESTPAANPIWQPIYDAIKLAYAGQADWGDE